MVPVLSVDLAYRRWSDLGIVVLDRTLSSECSGLTENAPGQLLNPLPAPLLARPDQCRPTEPSITCEIIPSFDSGYGCNSESGFESGFEAGFEAGPINAEILAGRLNHLCAMRDIRVMMLDGPKAWKSRHNGLEYARVSERQLNTAAKTGLPGMVKPRTYRAFAEFCLDLYDALCRRGWRRLETREQPSSPQGQNQERVLVESYPYAAWKSLGINPLPSKRRAKVSDLAAAYGALRSLIPFSINRPPNHDQLQAIVGGLPGLALEEGNSAEHNSAERNSAAALIVGSPPRREEGHWREGFIVLPLPPTRPIGLRWLNQE
jgi:hypothetical protein